MRLNRVLLLAATVSMMMFALVFTISCSGDDGKAGKNGENCELRENADGESWTVFCDDKEIGVLKNNDEGTPGAQGNPGGAGASGSSCSITSDFRIQCTTGATGSLDVCTIKTDDFNNHLSTITCGTTPPVYVCVENTETRIFDPKKYYCKADGSGVANAAEDKGTCANGKEYSISSQYCGIASASDTKDAPQDYCGGTAKIMLNKTQVSAANKAACEAITSDFGPTIWDGTKCWKSELNNEYCAYGIKKEADKSVEYAYASNKYCDGNKTLNKGKWNKEYCGWASVSATKLSVLKDVCDDYEYVEGGSELKNYGPNEKAYGYAYCTVTYENRDSKKTITTNVFCGNGDAINSKGSYAKEYCGFKNATAEKTSKLSGACDDGKGPSETSYSKDEYCQFNRDGESSLSSELCGTSKVNEKSWKGQYCGVNAKGADAVQTGICDDDKGPNKNEKEYCQADITGKTQVTSTRCDDNGTINEGEWNGEYCGYEEDAEETSVMKGACDDGDGPNVSSFGGGYCRADKKGVTKYVEDSCQADGGKPNDNEWKGEYCGKNSNGEEVLLTGVCDNGEGPDLSKGEYCQWSLDSDGTEATDDLCGGVAKYNEGTWKAEYCFKDGKVATCTGGRKANLEKNSTDAFSVRCPFQGDYVCTEDLLEACDADACADLGAGYIWNADTFECREAVAAPKKPLALRKPIVRR